MDWSLAPWTLTWDEVDPGRHPFDSDSAPEVVLALAPAQAVPVRPPGQPGDPELIDWADDVGGAWADSMTRSMVGRWGRWVAGWRWARDEGDFGGGPVSSWCCARDSITDAGETLMRVSDALAEWRAWLEELSGSFERYPLTRPAAPEDRVAWEHGAVDLVHRVVGRTGAGDAWYKHCAQVLTWFLARWGVAGEEARHLVEEAIGGHFHSWIEPAEADILSVADQLAHAVGELDDEPDER